HLLSQIKKSDIVLIYPSPLWYLTVLMVKFYNKKIILDHYTTNIYNFEFSNNYFKYICFIADSFFYKHFDLLLTHSSKMKNLIVKTYRIKSDRILVLYSIVNLKLFDKMPKNKSLIKKYKIDSKAKIVMYHGLFHPYHGVDVILAASKLLINENNVFMFI